MTTPALAQSGSSGMFAGAQPDSGGRDFLALQAAFMEALDSDVAPEFLSRVPGGRLPGRHSSVAALGIGYARNRRTVQLSAVTAGLFRYSYEAEQVKPGTASAQVGMGLRMPGRVGTLSLSQGLTWSPSYLYQLLPGAEQGADPDVEPEPPTDPDYRIDSRESLSHHSRLALQTGSGLGWAATTTAEYSQMDFRGTAAAGRGERSSWEAATRVSYRPTRRRGLLFGYRYRESTYRDGRPSQVHELPLGISFTPALTPSRRLSINIQVTPTLTDGFALVPVIAEDGDEVPETSETVTTTERRRRYAVQGQVGLSYPVSLRWSLSTMYERRVRTLAVISEPVTTDGARLNLSGVITRRVDVSMQARYSRGASTFRSSTERLATAQGTARVRVALARSVALSAEYLYYRYEVGDRILAPDLPPFFERHGVRVGISMFTQFLGR